MPHHKPICSVYVHNKLFKNSLLWFYGMAFGKQEQLLLCTWFSFILKLIQVASNRSISESVKPIFQPKAERVIHIQSCLQKRPAKASYLDRNKG